MVDDTNTVAKRCSKCRLLKLYEYFQLRGQRLRRLELRPECKECSKPRKNSWHRRNREQNPEKVAFQKAKAFYKLTDTQCIEAMAKKAGRKCDICNREPKKMCIDHDHVTGRYRGVLCGYCNSMLGMVEDRADILANAISYLAQTPQQPAPPVAPPAM